MLKTFTHNGTPIRYIDEGEGPVTLLFVHGAYIDHTYWQEQIDYFKPHYRVIAPDLAGHGESGKDRAHWSIRTLSEDLVAMLHDLELTNVILIAHSLGADIALAADVARPGAVLGFIAVDMFKMAGQPLPKEYQSQVQAILDSYKVDPAGTNEAYARRALVTPQTPPALAERVIRDYRAAYVPMGAQLLPDIFEAYKLEAMLLPKLDKKLYLINVDYMPTDEQALAQHLNAGYELIHMAGTSHYPMIENPQELNRLLDTAIEHIGEPSVT